MSICHQQNSYTAYVEFIEFPLAKQVVEQKYKAKSQSGKKNVFLLSGPLQVYITIHS